MAFLSGRGLHGQTAQPWETMISILEADAAGNPVLWVGSDEKIYGYGEDGNIYDFTNEYMASMQARPAGVVNNPYETNMGNRGFGNTGFGNNVSVGGGYGAPTGGTISVGSRNPRMNSEPTTDYAPRTTRSTRTVDSNATPSREVITDFKPRPGSEFIPLFDPEKEKIEVNLFRETKEFDLKTVRK